MGILDWFRRAPAEPSDEVKQALERSQERKEHAGRYLEQVEQEMQPIRAAYARNGFEDAVRATFLRRHA